MAIDVTCSKCYEAKLPACSVNYLIGGFAPNVDYHVIATDRFGNKYEVDEDKPSDPDGNVSIIFPEGLAEAGSGVLKLEVFRAEDLSVDGAFCRPQTFTTCDQSYSCFNISFYNLTKADPGSIFNWKVNCPCNELCYDCGADKTIIGFSSSVSNEGWYMSEHYPSLIHYDEDANVIEAIACDQIAPYSFYNDDGGPFIWDEGEAKNLPIFFYQPTGAEIGVNLTIYGTILRWLSEDCTFILQASIDAGITIQTLSGPYNYQELQAGVTVPIAYPSYRSRLKITTPDGCVYYSNWNTQTEA